MTKHIRVMKNTREDWYPAYELHGYYKGNLNPKMVEVSLLPLTNGLTRILVKGADDYGLERDFYDCEEAVKLFNRILSYGYIRSSVLKDLGFEPI